MKINLRTAASIQQALRAEIAEIDLTSQFETVISIYDNVYEKVTEASDAVEQNIQRAEVLITALYEIRQKVSEANATCGVDKLLNNIALLEARAKLYSGAAAAEGRESLDAVSQFFDDTKEGVKTGTAIGRHRQCVAVMTQNQLDELNATHRQIKRDVQSCKDKLLALNLTTEVEISGETAQLLVDAGLV
jgi:prefoldin subunit 5